MITIRTKAGAECFRLISAAAMEMAEQRQSFNATKARIEQILAGQTGIDDGGEVAAFWKEANAIKFKCNFFQEMRRLDFAVARYFENNPQ